MVRKLTAIILLMAFLIPNTVFAAADKAAADADALTLSVIAQYDGGLSQITRSLYLPDKGSVYNSDISWKSDNENYITSSGRVIRPRYDEDDVNVTLTATVSNGSSVQNKTFELTVLKDKKFTDPEHMSDEEFFGMYSNGVCTVQGKLDYTIPELSEVEKYAKTGEYELAKEALLSYFKNRKEPYSKDASLGKTRNSGWVEMITDDFYQTGSYGYYYGDIYIGNTTADYSGSVIPSSITPGMVSFAVRAWYNEASYARIHSKDNASHSPRIEAVVNGEKRTYTAVKDTSVRYGDYSNTPYGSEEYLTVKTFGDFLKEETYQSVITFDFNDIKETDTISEAKLILHGCTYPAFSGEKRLIILKEGTSVWDEKTAVRNSFPGRIYSFNGLPDKNTWQKVVGQESEYFWQSARFAAWPMVALEYYKTGNEEYAYKALAIMADYLNDTGGRKFVGTSSYTESEDGLRGGFPRSLDLGIKNTNWEKTLDTFKESPYFSADLLTAILKNIWDSAHYLTVYHSESENWRQHEFTNLLTTTQYLPEFRDAYSGEKWFDMSRSKLEEILFMNTMEDGSYVEPTTAYSIAAFSDFGGFKEKMVKMGKDVSEEYDERLIKNAYYNAMQYFPDGSALRYGDSSNVNLNAGTYMYEYKTYGETDLEYIVNHGSSGTEPEYTSYHWPDSRVTVMRDNWTTQSPYLITNVRGGGGHGHADANQIVLYAYGRTLLVDSGIFTYHTTGEMETVRQWGRSSLAHNTVVINDTSQSNEGIKGAVSDIRLEDDYNYIRQTTGNTEGFDHERAILYLKPDLWLVTDTVTADDKTTVNNFKQLWHCLPDANISADKKTIRTNYENGANLIITTADESEKSFLADGYYDKDSGNIIDIKYGVFEKEVSGKCTFDTLLTAVEDDSAAEVSSEVLLKNENASAVRFDVTLNGMMKTIYYYRALNSNNEFANFKTDADTLAIVCDLDGNIEDIVRIGGNYVKNTATGEIIDGTDIGDDFHAGVKEKNYAVYGSVDSAYAGETITAMLIKKDADYSAVSVDDIEWMSAEFVDENGEYMFKFKSDANIDEYDLRLNILGIPVEQNIVKATDNDALVHATVNATKQEDVLTAAIRLDNLYLQKDLKYKILIAYYDSSDKLIKVDCTEEKALTESWVGEQISSDYPQNTAKVKLMLWKDMLPVSDLKPDLVIE